MKYTINTTKHFIKKTPYVHHLGHPSMVQPTHISHVSPNVILTPTPVPTPMGYHWGLSIHRKASTYVIDVNKIMSKYT